MMKPFVFVIISFFAFTSCTTPREVSPAKPKYAPTDVLVQTKKTFTIDKVFDFINSYDFEVESITNSFYTSSLPSDSLQYVLNYLNGKPYLNDGSNWTVDGYLHYETQVIYVFPRIFNARDLKNQADWLATIKFLKLKEVTDHPVVGGSIIFFHVPEKEERSWAEKFKKLSFVEWAEVNSYSDAVPL
jgi:hypothetical protein